MEKGNDIKQSLYDIQPGDKVYFRVIISPQFMLWSE